MQVVQTACRQMVVLGLKDLFWLPFVDAYRTFLRNPGADGRRVLDQLASLPMSA